MAYWNQVVGQFNQVFGEISWGKRIVMILTLLLTMGALGYIIFEARKPAYTTAFYDLSPADAGKIDELVRGMNIAPQWSNDQSRLLVPEDRRDEVRMALAREGLPAGGEVGYEMMEALGPFSSNEVIQVNKLRAVQGELARAIMQLDPVKSAKVMIAMPEPTPFAREQKQATASVVLKLVPGAELSGKNVKGIVYLVSHAVNGLLPENVTVVDGNGKLLGGGQEEQGTLLDSQIALQRDFEEKLQSKIQTMLDRTVGSGRSVVRVSAKLNFTEQTVTEDAIDPDTATAVRSRTSQETVGGAVNRGGAPGAGANLPEGEPGGTGSFGGDPKVAKLVNEQTMALSKTTTVTRKESGQAEYVSVAALIDWKQVERSDEQGNKTLEAVEWSQEEQQRITQAIRAAANLDPENEKNQLAVNFIPFARIEAEGDSLAEASLMTAQRYRLIQFIVKWSVVAVICLLCFFVILRPLTRTLLTPAGVTAKLAGGGKFALPQGGENLPLLEHTGTIQQTLAEALKSGVSGELVSQMLAKYNNPNREASAALTRELSKLVKDNPQDGAQLIRKWLGGE